MHSRMGRSTGQAAVGGQCEEWREPSATVFVTTQHMLVCLRRRSNSCAPLWSISLIDVAHGGSSGETSVPARWWAADTGDIQPEVGVNGIARSSMPRRVLCMSFSNPSWRADGFLSAAAAVECHDRQRNARRNLRERAATNPATRRRTAVRLQQQAQNQSRAALAFGQRHRSVRTQWGSA